LMSIAFPPLEGRVSCDLGRLLDRLEAMIIKR
jgi:hypothetical protein